MARWMIVLVACLYLLPQAAVAFHSDELLEHCSACEVEFGGPTIQCGGEGCGDEEHHHHRHDRHHHFGNCRICSAGADVALESPVDLSCTFAATIVAPDPVAPRGADAIHHRPIRAPPGC